METIKVVLAGHKRGYKIINLEDFDPKVDKEFKAKAPRKPRTPKKDK